MGSLVDVESLHCGLYRREFRLELSQNQVRQRQLIRNQFTHWDRSDRQRVNIS